MCVSGCFSNYKTSPESASLPIYNLRIVTNAPLFFLVYHCSGLPSGIQIFLFSPAAQLPTGPKKEKLSHPLYFLDFVDGL